MRVTEDCFYALMRLYKTDPAGLTTMAPATQALWGRELDFAGRPDLLGAKPIDEIRPSVIQKFLDGMSGRPGKQAAALAAFRALERWAVVRDHLSRSITLGVKTGKPQGGHRPWTEEEVELGIAKARPDLARAILLGACTGQRGSDLVRMGWADVEIFRGQEGIKVVQKKTGRKLWVPIIERLRLAMGTWDKRPGPFLLTPWGEPWSRKQLSEAWNYERDRNVELQPLADLVLHGLRSHACVRLFRAGCTTRQVAELVGLSEPMVTHYCRLDDQKEAALAAVIQLQSHRKPRREDERTG